MSIWKKFASMLFEETDTDIIAEDELEDISFSDNENVPVKEEYIKKEEKVVREEPKVIQPVKETSKEDVKKFVSIEISDETPKPREKETTLGAVRAKRVDSASIREEKAGYEFTPVISPIFGSKDESVKVKSSSMSITLPKPKKANPLGTVISPYYGLGELEEFEAEAQENIEKKEKVKHEEVEFPQIENEAFVEEDEDVNSLSLDDLIMNNDQEEDLDDMMQISLFGESTPLRESDDEAENR